MRCIEGMEEGREGGREGGREEGRKGGREEKIIDSNFIPLHIFSASGHSGPDHERWLHNTLTQPLEVLTL